jgi:hypothetical protein
VKARASRPRVNLALWMCPHGEISANRLWIQATTFGDAEAGAPDTQSLCTAPWLHPIQLSPMCILRHINAVRPRLQNNLGISRWVISLLGGTLGQHDQTDEFRNTANSELLH